MIFGMWSYDPTVGGAAGTESDMFYFLDEEALSDSHPVPNTAATKGDAVAVAEKLDFDLPGHRKAVDSVNLWVRGSAAGDSNVTVGLSKDHGSTWDDITKSAVSHVKGEEQILTFQGFDRDSAEVWWLRIKLPEPAYSIIEQMEVWGADFGRVEAG